MLRFAPSPTGDMHIGNLRVALLNYLVSCQKNEDLIIRIEDTQKEKNIDGKDQEILDILDLFGIKYTQTIYQSQNFKFHSAMALQLLHEKKAFSCFCSDNWIAKKKEEAKDANVAYSYDDACRNLPAELVIDNTSPFCVRITRPDVSIQIKDLIQGDLSFSENDVDSFVILNQDKTPTCDFSAAVDDMISDVSLVIRSSEHIKSAPKQAHVRHSLGYDKSVAFAHVPVLLNENNQPMGSKDEGWSVKALLEQGFLPEAISNYLISIGNAPAQEIFTLDQAVEFFTLDTALSSPARFSMQELKNINKKHLLELEAKELSRYVGFADSEIGELARVFLEDVFTTKELKSKIAPIFAQKTFPSELTEVISTISQIIKKAPFFDKYEDFEKYLKDGSQIQEPLFSQALRYILTGTKNGPELTKVYKYLKNYIGEIVK